MRVEDGGAPVTRLIWWTLVIIATAYVVAGLVLLAVVVGCLWDGWRQ